MAPHNDRQHRKGQAKSGSEPPLLAWPGLTYTASHQDGATSAPHCCCHAQVVRTHTSATHGDQEAAEPAVTVLPRAITTAVGSNAAASHQDGVTPAPHSCCCHVQDLSTFLADAVAPQVQALHLPPA